ncbi:uncharacterized protein RJT21DRAFT_121316 [Scheffersomyces amazonensis]|uniref:uncharacterized protein n=1 Tax=Scheffersomyces amazonensis TaxID=1078765 RepID=UPI00315C5B24
MILPYVLGIFHILGLCLANTETIVFKVPYYYNIKPHASYYDETIRNNDIIHLNETHSLIKDYPIQTIKTLDKDKLTKYVIQVDDYSSIERPEKTLLVKINNYGDETFESNDFINVKLCWPTIYPFDFKLDYLFIKPTDLQTHKSEEQNNELDKELDIYIAISYKFFAHSYNPEKYYSDHEPLEFHLFINKLANKWIPIPNELYQFLMYFVDLLILGYNLIPYLYDYIFQ